MANIILRAVSSWTEEQYKELVTNGAMPMVINVEVAPYAPRPFLFWQSSWKWQPCPSLVPEHSRDIDAWGTGGSNTCWQHYANKNLHCV